MRNILFLLLCSWPLALWADVAIEHKEVGCVEAGKFPRFDARFDPADAVARARLHFKPEGWPHWYSVPMARQGAGFQGVLPKPDKKLQKFGYYISVVDRTLKESRTPEYAPLVVGGPGGCQQSKALAVALEKAAQVIVSGPEGVANVPLLPAGFSTDGVVAGSAGTASGAPGAAGSGGSGTVTAAAAGAAVGGGVPTALLIGGGVVAAGGVAAVAAKGSGGGGSSPPPPTTTPTPAPTPTPTPAPSPSPGFTFYHLTFSPNVDVSVCAGRQLSWCCQNVPADANGNFDTTWAPNDPNTARVTGTVTATAFNATIRCTSGSPSGTLTATGSGGNYSGSFDFAGSSGRLTVSPGP